jgi:hypothetical protein
VSAYTRPEVAMSYDRKILQGNCCLDDVKVKKKESFKAEIIAGSEIKVILAGQNPNQTENIKDHHWRRIMKTNKPIRKFSAWPFN